MPARNIEKRLQAIERTQRARCKECGDAPIRILGTDPGTGEVLTSNMLTDECPACGRNARHTVEIVGVDVGLI